MPGRLVSPGSWCGWGVREGPGQGGQDGWEGKRPCLETPSAGFGVKPSAVSLLPSGPLACRAGSAIQSVGRTWAFTGGGGSARSTRLWPWRWGGRPLAGAGPRPPSLSLEVSRLSAQPWTPPKQRRGAAQAGLLCGQDWGLGSPRCPRGRQRSPVPQLWGPGGPPCCCSTQAPVPSPLPSSLGSPGRQGCRQEG